jgi:hypothetical protein
MGQLWVNRGFFLTYLAQFHYIATHQHEQTVARKYLNRLLKPAWILEARTGVEPVWTALQAAA